MRKEVEVLPLWVASSFGVGVDMPTLSACVISEIAVRSLSLMLLWLSMFFASLPEGMAITLPFL